MASLLRAGRLSIFQIFPHIHFFEAEKVKIREECRKIDIIHSNKILRIFSSHGIYSRVDVYQISVNFPPGHLFRPGRLLGRLEYVIANLKMNTESELNT